MHLIFVITISFLFLKPLVAMVCPSSFIEFLKDSSFVKVPTEVKGKIFEFACNKPIDYYKTITMLSKSFHICVIQKDFIAQKEFIHRYLKERDSAIEFLYFFTENPDGNYHHQEYQKLPLSESDTIAMKEIVLLIRYIACKRSKPVNEIAQAFDCLQYIRLHEEFCFRAIVPQTRCSWGGNYQDFITTTCQEYLTVFDENYIVSPDFSNDTQWLTEKIKASNSVNIKNINQDTENSLDLKHAKALDMAQTATKNNAAEKNLIFKLPNSLFDIILFYGKFESFTIASEESFDEYAQKLFRRNETIFPGKPSNLAIPEINIIESASNPSIIKEEQNEEKVEPHADQLGESLNIHNSLLKIINPQQSRTSFLKEKLKKIFSLVYYQGTHWLLFLKKLFNIKIMRIIRKV